MPKYAIGQWHLKSMISVYGEDGRPQLDTWYLYTVRSPQLTTSNDEWSAVCRIVCREPLWRHADDDVIAYDVTQCPSRRHPSRHQQAPATLIITAVAMGTDTQITSTLPTILICVDCTKARDTFNSHCPRINLGMPPALYIHLQRKASHGLDGQHQDVDRTLRGRVNQNDRGQG